MMSAGVMDRCVDIVASHSAIGTVDITGGAPELHPGFESLVERVRALGRRVLVRHNLTVTLDPHPQSGTSLAYLPSFFARNGVEVIASLPCYTRPNTDGQRGAGVFDKSIASLRLLNREGYGIPDSGLVLNLVSNPLGAYLPSSQAALEADFRRELLDSHGVRFNSLFAIANMPIARFAGQLDALGVAEAYTEHLASNCNPAAAAAVMCRSMASVSYDGTLYDCDFNQMLDLAIGDARPLTVLDFDESRLLARDIRFAEHCLGCTAGAGSSCGGATA
jgi:radical SAM/Cys-rich protein